MTESNAQKFITEASQALDNHQYAVAEELQRRAIQLLEAQSAEATRIADELETLAGIHFQQGKLGALRTSAWSDVWLAEKSGPYSALEAGHRTKQRPECHLAPESNVKPPRGLPCVALPVHCVLL